MGGKGQILVTIVIWCVFLTLSIITMAATTGPISHLSGTGMFGMLLMLSVMALLGTEIVWSTNRQENTQQQTLSHLAKSKRIERNRVERLIESLDDDEIYQLEELLLAARDDSSRQQGRNP
jgi:hypothetical protein